MTIYNMNDYIYTYIHTYIYIYIIYICICYNTAGRDLPDIYARRPRVRSARGRVRIYPANPDRMCYNKYISLPLLPLYAGNNL